MPKILEEIGDNMLNFYECVFEGKTELLTF